MNHPRNKAERRRINKSKKKYYDREEHVQARLAQEKAETKEILRQLKTSGSQNKQEELD